VDPVDEPLPGTGYIFSAGRSHRDWDTFLEAVAGLDTPVKLVATKADMAGRTLPANVELHTDIPHKDYLELLKDAEVVVIPLVPMNRSTGQAAFLEAMAYGKPLVVTSVIGSADYIRDGVNGCLVPSQSPDALRDTLRKLMADERLRQGIGSAALQSIRSEFNKEVYSERFCTMVERHLGI
jgi:glycosyltransferase involved in cell wall biosynthesis